LPIAAASQGEIPERTITQEVYFSLEGGASKALETPVYDLESLKGGM
jgi:hypothetical protein